MQNQLSLRLRWLLPVVISSVLGALLRCWQLASAFEENGLVQPWAQPSVILLCVLLISAAVLAMVAAQQPIATNAEGNRLDMDKVMLDPQDKFSSVLLIASAFLALMASPVMLYEGWNQHQLFQSAFEGEVSNNGVLQIATGVGAVFAFAGLLKIAQESSAPGRRGRSGFGAALPAACNCIWMMEHFRAYAPDPVLWRYAPQLLAIILGMMFYIDLAGLSGTPARPRRVLWYGGMSMVLTAVSAVSAIPAFAAISSRNSVSFGDLLLLVSQFIAEAAVLWRLSATLARPSAPQAPEPENADEDGSGSSSSAGSDSRSSNDSGSNDSGSNDSGSNGSSSNGSSSPIGDNNKEDSSDE